MERACWECGCTETSACMTDGIGCRWVDDDLCSACESLDDKEARLFLQAASNGSLGVAQLLTHSHSEVPAFSRETVTYFALAAIAAAEFELLSSCLDEGERETLDAFAAEARRFITDWVG